MTKYCPLIAARMFVQRFLFAHTLFSVSMVASTLNQDSCDIEPQSGEA